MALKKIGHYTVVSELGRGGMGVVYKAHEESLNRFVAIKVLGEHLSSEPSFLTRFEREAQAAAALNHPNITQIFFIGEDEGLHYFVMEYVSGKSLLGVVRDEGHVDNPRAAGYILQAASGLAAAHDKGILHRDIKPANLMLNEIGLIKIADFGLALPLEAVTRLTATGMLMGTPGYLSPEQCMGEQADHRTDIYALGVTYYELLTGRMPFQADSPLVLMRQILETEPPDVGTVNQSVDEETRRILRLMIAKNRDQRYQSCHELIADLDDYVSSRRGRAVSAGLPQPQVAGVTRPTPAQATAPAPSAAAAAVKGPPSADDKTAAVTMQATARVPTPPAAPAAPTAPVRAPTPPAVTTAAMSPQAAPAAAPPPAPAVAVQADPIPPPSPLAAPSAIVPTPQAPPLPVVAAAPPPTRSGSSRAVLLVVVLLVVVLGGAVGAIAVLKSASGQRFLASNLPAGVARLAGVTSSASSSPSTDTQTTPDQAAFATHDTAGSEPPAGSARAAEPGAEVSSPGGPGGAVGAAAAGAGAVAAEAAPALTGSAATGSAGGEAVARGGHRAGTSGEQRSSTSSSMSSVPEAGSRVGERSRPRQAGPVPGELSGVAYAVTGEPMLAGSVGSILSSELAAAGVEATDAQSLPATEGALRGGGEASVAELINSLRSAGMATLVLARVDHVGERDLNYLNRHDVAYSSRVTVTCYDLASGRPVGRSNSAVVEYTQLNVDRQAEKVVAPLASAAAAAIGRR